jgi:hypothetical protein
MPLEPRRRDDLTWVAMALNALTAMLAVLGRAQYVSDRLAWRSCHSGPFVWRYLFFAWMAAIAAVAVGTVAFSEARSRSFAWLTLATTLVVLVGATALGLLR